MSALPPIADIGTQPRNVRFVPIADIAKAGGAFAEAVIRSVELIVQPAAQDVCRLLRYAIAIRSDSSGQGERH
jgi:hypothetical protein